MRQWRRVPTSPWTRALTCFSRRLYGASLPGHRVLVVERRCVDVGIGLVADSGWTIRREGFRGVGLPIATHRPECYPAAFVGGDEVRVVVHALDFPDSVL